MFITKLLTRHKVLLVVLLIATSRFSFAQQYFVRTDLFGYAYHIGLEKEIKQSITLKYSLGVERMCDSSFFSFGGLLNYGTLPDWTYGSSFPYGLNDFVQGSTGLSIQPEIRYYWRKDKPKYFKGVFVSGYLMYFNGTHHYDVIFPPVLGYREVARAESRKFQILAIGIGIGYKVLLGKKFFVEPFLGFGKGKYFPKISDIGVVSFHSGNLLPRLELSAGYCIQ